MNKIAILAPEIHEPFIEGIQKNAWAVSRALAQTGADVTIFTQCSYGQKITDDNIKINYKLSARKNKIIKYLNWLADGLKIANQIKKSQAEQLLVFSLDWSFITSIIWVALLSRKTKIRLVCFSLRELTGLNNFFFNLTKNKFDFVFPRSNYLKEKLISHGFPEKKIKVVTTLPNKERFMTMFDVPNTIKRIAYLSSAEKNAGIDLIPQLAESLPDITFTVALRQFGAREESTTKSLAENLENKKLKNLFVVRNITDIVSFYKQQDAIILPPLNERDTMSAPLVLFEAFLSGRLVLLSDLPLFKDYQNLSFCFKDLKDLINIINEIKTNSEKIEQKIKVAYEYATQLPSQIDAAKIYQS